MPQNDRPQLVAETDGSGQVAQVWLAMPGWRAPRPMRDGDLSPSLLADSEFSGAPRAAITDWVERHAS